eukprot:CAMPEP_0176452968 /NCGR_PEP_ID=MMETSP0127-20121128/28911_1 /TAXON_ID=938130 /ORGANISM="Platyophrya macrostoma, Strain WH" /LENGTH=70 /DNA_ID=CAMNT_0017841643 /DNA_START=452 /DNA_END=664 /DNA_ORIENTATION=-
MALAVAQLATQRAQNALMGRQPIVKLVQLDIGFQEQHARLVLRLAKLVPPPPIVPPVLTAIGSTLPTELA